MNFLVTLLAEMEHLSIYRRFLKHDFFTKSQTNQILKISESVVINTLNLIAFEPQKISLYSFYLVKQERTALKLERKYKVLP